jgi:hypothetical protein
MNKTLAIFSIIFLFAAANSSAQSWRPATDTLKNPSEFGQAEGSIAYISKYDTIPCKYRVEGDTHIYNGYRFVYKQNGYYTDDTRTLHVFLDIKRRRIFNVKEYCFVSSF